MANILAKLQKHPQLHAFLRKIYGKTIGLYYLKEWYMKNIGLYNGRRRLKLISNPGANMLISKNIESGNPFMLARYGSTEFRSLFSNDAGALYIYSGFFPNDNRLMPKFKKEYLNSSKKIDFLSVWNYKNNFLKKRSLIRKLSNIKNFLGVSAITSKEPWTKSLKNKRVLVIHPFKKTIEKQYKKREKLKILPKLKSLQIIKAVQTIAGNTDLRFETWFDALNYMKKEVNGKKFDIALIGCGAYGLPLAAHVKSMGKQAIHIGGDLQLLFGIKGKRWENYGIFNEHWIYPLPEDTPRNNKKVEGGCYWK